ncbi:SAM-dependent methyltransferase [Ferrimonas lipolytica]|uniref:Class I SAM-dependent methyltransferase n=1 Tax=Ferrimonas lipolytica TaxID=2724191 RepID=A0A6H1UAL7_9GAMM|nr:cyclopropane-fatty-acyl-phospholipid synthase family protein [Ferrimonas lipolytica]QIZ75679.1 class I SAM-dependent methyltransferase [Ferrimonas lipolytica]
MLEQVDPPQSRLSGSITGTVCRKLAMAVFSRLRHGQLQIRDGDQLWQVGDEGPVAQLIINDPLAWQKLLLGGSIGMAEAYRDGLWHSDDLTGLIGLFSRNLDLLDKLEGRFSWASKPLRKVSHLLRHNSKANSRKNIEAHYDLSNEFYQLFLDDTMLYSSALFSNSDDLEQAQYAKMERLCQQLQLGADDHLLEIGTGWGAMAIYAAKHYGCRVTTTTISKAQHQEAQRRIAAAGLSDRITLLMDDYRDLNGCFDKIVSIEMIEAVGERYLESYFQQLQQLLKPGGRLAIQAITIADQRYQHYRNNVDFIQTYIFPGGFLPSVEVLSQQFRLHTSMVIRNIEDIGLDYGHTLALWRQRFESQLDQVEQLGFDLRFIRLWRFYFCYCQAGFETRRTSAIQLTADKALY